MDKREKFLHAVGQLERIDGGDWTAEPWPVWFLKVVLRLSRVFAPGLKKSDLTRNRKRFEGLAVAFIGELISEAEKVDLAKFPDGRLVDVLREQLQSIKTVEADCYRAALHAASDLPSDEQQEFFAGYGDGLGQENAAYAMARLGDSQTAQICTFLIFARPAIEKGEFANVTALLNRFMRIKEVFPGQKAFFEANPGARRSWAQHFRKICTLDGLKLAGRGQPKRIRTGKA
jgi:hypothetical protein